MFANKTELLEISRLGRSYIREYSDAMKDDDIMASQRAIGRMKRIVERMETETGLADQRQRGHKARLRKI